MMMRFSYDLPVLLALLLFAPAREVLAEDALSSAVIAPPALRSAGIRVVPARSAGSEFVGLDRNGDLSCDSTDMLKYYCAGDVGSVDSFAIYFDGVPDSSVALRCSFCVKEKSLFTSESFTYSVPSNWITYNLIDSDEFPESLWVSDTIRTMYPDYKCYRAMILDSLLSGNLTYPAKIGTFKYEVASEGCAAFVIDVFFSSWFTSDPDSIYFGDFRDPGATCDTVSCVKADVSESAISFGSVRVGATATDSFTIANRGSQPLAGRIGEECLTFSVAPDSFQIAPGDSVSVLVRYSPTDCVSEQCDLAFSLPCASPTMLSGTGVGTPDAPSECTATDDNCRQVEISWTDNSTGEDGFIIRRNSDIIDTVAANVVSYIDKPVPRTYIYAVEAFNRCGLSEESTDSGARSTGVPSPPDSLAASDTSASFVRLDWPSSSGADRYILFRDGVPIDTLNAPAVSYTDIPPVRGSHVYGVAAENDCGSLDTVAATGVLLDEAGPVSVSIATAAETFRQIAVPVIATDNRPTAVFDELGTADRKKWRLGRWNAAAQSYDEAPDGIDSIVPGAGYWLITRESASLSVEGVPISMYSAFTVTVEGDSGSWHQLGNPYRDDLPADNISIAVAGDTAGLTEEGNGFTSHQVWGGAGAPYTAYGSGSMIPENEGFWLRKITDQPAVVVFTPPATGKEGHRVDAVRRKDDRYGEESSWLMEIFAVQDGRRSNVIRGGMVEGALTGWDLLDEAIPPAPPEPATGLFLSMPRDRWGAMAGRYAADYRSPGDGGVWEFEVRGASVPGEVTLGFAFPRPPSGDVTIRDATGGISVPIGPGGEFTFAATGDARRFIVEVDGNIRSERDTAFVERESPVVAYPNPFVESTGFRFFQPSSSAAEARIYDAAGRLVRVIRRDSVPAGEHVITWDGRNGDGRVVSPGVYLVRLFAGGEGRTYRLVKIR